MGAGYWAAWPDEHGALGRQEQLCGSTENSLEDRAPGSTKSFWRLEKASKTRGSPLQASEADAAERGEEEAMEKWRRPSESLWAMMKSNEKR